MLWLTWLVRASDAGGEPGLAFVWPAVAFPSIFHTVCSAIHHCWHGLQRVDPRAELSCAACLDDLPEIMTENVQKQIKRDDEMINCRSEGI